MPEAAPQPAQAAPEQDDGRIAPAFSNKMTLHEMTECKVETMVNKLNYLHTEPSTGKSMSSCWSQKYRPKNSMMDTTTKGYEG